MPSSEIGENASPHIPAKHQQERLYTLCADDGNTLTTDRKNVSQKSLRRSQVLNYEENKHTQQSIPKLDENKQNEETKTLVTDDS